MGIENGTVTIDAAAHSAQTGEQKLSLGERAQAQQRRINELYLEQHRAGAQAVQHAAEIDFVES